ncbi:flagellar motor protein MotD [Methylohalobius crimeensis]|uniref:flagellar motor protein MotD n=1 Tax=Methylohalobius crimeensis TaxID=244365 RepID=UPI0003B5C05D|nr:flagellar motor protein MotD [Methylohalobius crimeensis]
MSLRSLRRRRLEEASDSPERWVISYADFITLLFAFFVVMYAISVVNVGKYKVLSESLEKVFKDRKASVRKVPDPIQVGEIPRTSDPIQVDGVSESANLQRLAKQIEEVLAPYIDDDLVTVERDEYWIAVEMKSGILFPSGSAELSDEADPVLTKLAEIVRQMPANPIYIEGHTDNVPIHTRAFPSNWELSAARAASVVRRLADYGIVSRRMAAIGYGENHPVAGNATAAGRYRNRRVVMVLQAKNLARYQVTAGERGRLLAASAPQQTSE